MGGGIKGWDLGKTPAPRDFNNSIWRPQEKYRSRGDLLEKYPGVIPGIFEWRLGRPPFGQQGHPLIKICFLGSRIEAQQARQHRRSRRGGFQFKSLTWTAVKNWVPVVQNHTVISSGLGGLNGLPGSAQAAVYAQMGQFSPREAVYTF